jgi:hypothetical protein
LLYPAICPSCFRASDRLSSGLKNASAKMSIVRELSLDAEIFLAYVHSQPELKRETEQYPKQKKRALPRRGQAYFLIRGLAFAMNE